MISLTCSHNAHPLDILIHSNWKINTRDYIAVIKLSTPVAFNDALHTICMWQCNEPPAVNFRYIVGTILYDGKSENDAPHEIVPLQLHAQIITNEQSLKISTKHLHLVRNITLCGA